MVTESTRALVIGLFVVTGQRELTAAQLIRLARPLGVSPTNLKSHLTRMVQEGALVRRGFRRSFTYAPSGRRQFVMDAIRTRIGMNDEKWDGRWIVLMLSPPVERGERNLLRSRLHFDGFRDWTGFTFLRPAWPFAWARERSERHAARAGGLVAISTITPGPRYEALLGLYNLDDFDLRARRLLQRIEATLVALPTPQRALALRLQIGAEMARLASDDPRVPQDLWGPRTSWRDLAAAFRRCDAKLEKISRRHVDKLLAPPQSRHVLQRGAAA